MKIKWLISTTSLLTAVSLPMISLSSCNDKGKKVTSIVLDSVQGIKLNSGESLKATISVSPSNAKDKSVTYYSSNPNVLSIDANGNISAKAAGNTTIWAKANDGSNIESNKIDITVYESLPIEKSAQEYIYNRTFAFGGIYKENSTYKGTVGTCWVVGDSTPDDHTDYSYKIATNWHVAKGIQEISGKTEFAYKFGTSPSSGLDLAKDYTTFASITRLDDNEFYLDGTTTAQCYEEGYKRTGKAGIDLHMYNVTFFNKNQSLNDTQQAAKDKLDILNKYTQAGLPITRLANSITKDVHYENKDLYIAGFPAKYKQDQKQTWEYHSLKDENINLSLAQPGLNTNHACDDYVNNVDATCQYMLPSSETPKSLRWMSGGASGSMLLGNFGTSLNPYFKVCGIYWGGTGNEYYDIFYPHFSIFNSYIKNYINI